MAARPVETHDDVAAFFDSTAAAYSEQHGDAEILLRYRLDLLRQAAGIKPSDTVLEVGCGNGLHLLALAGEFECGIGIDLSPAMIEAARRRATKCPHGDRVSFSCCPAETLESVGDSSVDVVLCVGSLEHFLDRAAVFRSIFRVLRPGGNLACLTLNGSSLWYRWVAPVCGIEMRQLDTDRFLTPGELARLSTAAGFRQVGIAPWTFIQRGDMPRFFAWLFERLDRLGRWFGIAFLRGGLQATTIKPRR